MTRMLYVVLLIEMVVEIPVMNFCLCGHFRQSERLWSAVLPRELRHIFVKVVSDFLLRRPHWSRGGRGGETGGHSVGGERQVEGGAVSVQLAGLSDLSLTLALHSAGLPLSPGDQGAEGFAVFMFHQNSFQRTRGFTGGGGGAGGDLGFLDFINLRTAWDGGQNSPGL